MIGVDKKSVDFLFYFLHKIIHKTLNMRVFKIHVSKRIIV